MAFPSYVCQPAGGDLKSPDLRPAFHALCLLLAPAVFAEPLQLQVLDNLGKPVSGTVVTLRSTDPARALAQPVRATMDQVDLAFAPHVLVIPAGSKVDFPNSDKVRHQVYSFSSVKRFELPLYSGKPPAPELFDKSGVATLGCNIHDQMRAYVYVVEAQYYGRTDGQGSWHAPDVVPGEYTIQIWHPLSRSSNAVIDQKITVAADAGILTLRLAAPLKLRPISQVPANWDAY